MMVVGSKRRRTKRQIEEDKEEEIRKEEDTRQALAELASMRARMQELEQQAVNGKAAASLINQMINAGHIQQDSETTIVLNGPEGQHRFGAEVPGTAAGPGGQGQDDQ